MGRVRETLHDALRQTDAVLLALCVASTLYGMVLIASATSFRGTLKYVAVQGLGLLIGLVLYFFLSSIWCAVQDSNRQKGVLTCLFLCQSVP